MPTSASLVLFLLAAFSGIFFAFLTFQKAKWDRSDLVRNTRERNLPAKRYDKWLREYGLQRSGQSEGGSLRAQEARFLFNQVPVLCLIHAGSRQQVRSISSTWTRHCNQVAYFGNFTDDYVPIHQIPKSAASRDVTCDILNFVRERFGGKFQWLLLADDQTFAIVENLRIYVAPLNASEVHYLGHPLRDFRGFHYNTLNAGIVLSEGSVTLLEGLLGKSDHDATDLPLDKFVGRTLAKNLVSVVDTRDAKNRGRFNPFSVENMLIPGSISYFDTYWSSSLFLSAEGGGCCSDRAVTFHGVNPVEMFLMEYLVYRLHLGGTGRGRLAPTGAPVRDVPLDLRSLMNGKAFVKPFGIGVVDEFRMTSSG